MRKNLVCVIILLLMISLWGCDKGIDTKEEQDEVKIYGFYELGKAPKASKEQLLDNVIKIKFRDIDEMKLKSAIAIDIGKNGLFFEPNLENSSLDYDMTNYKLTQSDINQLLIILDKYKVMEWSELYGDKEGYKNGVEDGGPSFWELGIQFSDGTVKMSYGYYNGEEEFPENLRPFIKELEEFVSSKEAKVTIEE